MEYAVLLILVLIGLVIKFRPNLDRIEDNLTISYIVHYTLHKKYGSNIRDYFILFTINK